jgi:hypothetical protein
MAWLAEELVAVGIAVTVPTWRAEDADWDVWVAAIASGICEATVGAAQRQPIEAGEVSHATTGVILVGQSAGAPLCAAVVGRGLPPESVDHVVFINPVVVPVDDDSLSFLRGRLERGKQRLPVDPSTFEDCLAVDPDSVADIDLAGFLALHDALPMVDFAAVATLTTVVFAPADDVLGPEHLDHLRTYNQYTKWTPVAGRHVASLDSGRFALRDELIRLSSG